MLRLTDLAMCLVHEKGFFIMLKLHLYNANCQQQHISFAAFSQPFNGWEARIAWVRPFNMISTCRDSAVCMGSCANTSP